MQTVYAASVRARRVVDFCVCLFQLGGLIDSRETSGIYCAVTRINERSVSLKREKESNIDYVTVLTNTQVNNTTAVHNNIMFRCMFPIDVQNSAYSDLKSNHTKNLC